MSFRFVLCELINMEFLFNHFWIPNKRNFLCLTELNALPSFRTLSWWHNAFSSTRTLEIEDPCLFRFHFTAAYDSDDIFPNALPLQSLSWVLMFSNKVNLKGELFIAHRSMSFLYKVKHYEVIICGK